MTEQILIQSATDVTIQDRETILIDAPTNQVTLDQAPLLMVENRQPKLELFLHGLPGPRGERGEQGTAASLGLLGDVQLTTPLGDRDMLQYRTAPRQWINSNTLDGGNM